MPKTNINRSQQLASDLKLLAGILKYLPNTSLVIAGKSYTTTEVAQVLKSRTDARSAVLTTRAVYQAAVKVDHDEEASTKAFVDALRAVLLNLFANALDKLAELGLTPKKVRKSPSPPTMVVAAAKRRATRTARHTMSAKEKANIQGVVNAPVVVVPAPATPAVVTGGAPAQTGQKQ